MKPDGRNWARILAAAKLANLSAPEVRREQRVSMGTVRKAMKRHKVTLRHVPPGVRPSLYGSQVVIDPEFDE